MEIEIIHRSEEESNKYDYRQAMIVKIDNVVVFKVEDGEVEDSNMCRNFSDVYAIPGLLKQAYDAGKNGEAFNIVTTESGDI